jgi:hypothetical protein
MGFSEYYQQFTGIEVVAASSQRMIGGGSLTKKESRIARTTPMKMIFENVAEKRKGIQVVPSEHSGIN